MSDQDFFFEEEERPTEDAAPAKSTPKSGGSKSAAKPVASDAAPVAQQSVSMTVAGLVAACALLVGVIVGLVIPRQPSAATVDTGTTGTSTAPQLTPEQMEGGSLPAGHPDISSMGGGATGAPAATTTTP